MRGFFSSLSPLFLSTNIVHFVVSLGIMCLSGHTAVLWWCEILCCFESVRTVCGVHRQCQPQLAGWRMWIDVITLWHRQVQHEQRWKEFLFVLSGNCTGTHWLKSAVTLGTNLMSTTVTLPTSIKHFITLYDMALAEAKTIACWLGLFWRVIRDWCQTVSVYLSGSHNNV